MYGAHLYVAVALSSETAATISQVGPSAAAAGVRVGDVVDVSALSATQEDRLIRTFADAPVEFPLRAANGPRLVRARADIPLPTDPTRLYEVLVAALALTICAYLGCVKPGPMVFALTFSIGGEVLAWYGLSPFVTSLPGIVSVPLMATLRIYAQMFPALVLAAFVVRLPGTSPSPAKLRATRIVDVILAAGLITECVRQFTGPRLVGPNIAVYTAIYTALSFVVVLGAALAAVRFSPRTEISRIGIVLAAASVSVIPYAFGVLLALSGSRSSVLGHIFEYLGELMLPLALAYAVLRHRIFDISFVLNRSLVYALTSAFVLVLFALLEFLAERYLTTLTHAESLVLEFGIALAVVLGARVVHGRVDALVDGLLFRERHQQEQALERFATTVQFFTERDALLEATVEAMLRYARVEGAAIYLVERGALVCRSSRFSHAPDVIDENDLALTDLRAHGEAIETRDYGTALPGERVYPMILIGHLTGALVLGRRESGEAMPPDIDAAVRRVAAAVAIAVESIESARMREELSELRSRVNAASA